MNDQAARNLVDLLRAKAIKMAKLSEGNDNKKGFWQAGQAEGLGWAADHLEVLLNETKPWRFGDGPGGLSGTE